MAAAARAVAGGSPLPQHGIPERDLLGASRCNARLWHSTAMFKPLTCTWETSGEADTDWECWEMGKIEGPSEEAEFIAAFTIGVALSQLRKD